MYSILEVTPEFEAIESKRRDALKSCLELVAPVAEGRLVPANTPLFEDDLKGKLVVLREGTLFGTMNEKMLFFFEEGDLIGFEAVCGVETMSVQADFAVRVDVYDGASFFTALGNHDAWNRYLAYTTVLLREVVSGLYREDRTVFPNIRSFDDGATIIEAGTTGDEVFTLVEGKAEVFVDSVKVGEVLQDEIFGALAALTGTQRTASVRASGRCLVAALPKGNFLSLIQTRPHTVLKLVEDMARSIVSLNARVVELSGEARRAP